MKITAEQQARLTELRAQTTRTADEEAEMKTLAALDGAAPETQAEKPAATKPPVSGIADRAIALFRDKGALMNEITTLRSENGTHKAEIARLTADLARVTGERDAHAQEISLISAALATEQTKTRDVQAEVTTQLATLGVPESQLPAAAKSSEEPKSELAKLEAQFAAETDAVKRGVLAAKIDAAYKAKAAA
jgi:chromosome segregation ATPase